MINYMNLDLKNKEWKEFFLNDVFSEIQRGKRLKKDDHKKGTLPYVSSTSLNNGIDSFVGNKEGVRKFGNCLTIANSGSVGSTFYQPFEFVASDHVTKLKNSDFTKYVYQFISVVCYRLGDKYSFNREINEKRIQREKILLPTNSKGEPDYEFMDEYIQHKEQKNKKEYREFIQNRLNQLKDTPKTTAFSQKEWMEFKIVDIFNPSRGDQNKMSSLLDGDKPLISAKNGNNGLKAFVSLNKKKIY